MKIQKTVRKTSRQLRDAVKKTLGEPAGDILDAVGSTFGKPADKLLGAVDTMVTPPVTFLTDTVNTLFKSLEEKTRRKEVVSEVDGFMDKLLNEARDAEKGLFALFGELLFMHNLNEQTSLVENEIALVEVLGQRTYQFLKPDFVVAYMKQPAGDLLAAYRMPQDESLPWSAFRKLAEDNFASGEAVTYENKKMAGRLFDIASVPLRTTSEKIGVLLVGRASGKRGFRSEEIGLVIGGASIISFMLSNIKMHQKILRDERLVTIGETIAGLSHDIKNILTNLEGGLSLMDTGVKEKDLETVETGRGILRRSYERMKDMVLAMVDYSRERQPDLQETDVNALLGSVLDADSDLLAEKKVRVKREFDLQMPRVYVDPARIDRLADNLVHNALDAVAPGKGRINVGTRYLPDEKIVHIWVKDNGHGIPAAALNRIFDIFYSTKGTRGTGFGLAIVQKIVREHRGVITVNSTVGKGTTFHVKIPVRISGQGQT